MSMRELADPGDGAWLEAEIEQELAQLSPVDNDLGLEDGDDLDQEEDFQDNDDYDDDVPESLAVYLERVQSRAGLVEEGLKECEDVMHHTVTHADPRAMVPFTSTDLLDQLAASTGQNPAELKRRVLEEIEAEERDDEDEMGMLDENSTGVEEEEDVGGGQAEAATAGADTGETAGEDSLENAQTGAVVLYGVDDLERQLTLQLRRFHQEQQAQQRQLEEQLQLRRQEEDSWRLEQEQRSKQRDAEFHKQQEQLEKHKQEEQARLDAQLQEEGRRKGELLRQQEQQIQQLSQQTAEEKAAFYKQQEEENKRLETQKQKSAAKIQAAFKSYKVRKIHGPVLKEKRENRKKSWALNRQLEIEKHKKEEELKQRLDEQERKRKEHEKRKEEERKREVEEERRRKEQEEMERIEEERKRKEEEKKRMEEEAKRKQEEEERRKREEEGRKRQEEEKRKQEEKKREEERLRLEEERKKKEEAERKQKEEQLRRIQEEEEKRKMEEERKKLAEQEKRRKEEEQKRMEEEAKLRKEAEEKTIENVKINNPEQVNDNLDGNSKDSPLGERTVLTQEDVTAIADDLERRRLQWMEACRPWSQVSAELKRRKPKKGGRGAAKHASAKNLPDLTDEQLLKASKPGTPLDKVEEVNIAGLTGCSLSRLSECPGLLSITVNQCEAQVLYGVQRFTCLQHINVSQNRLTMLVCSGCASLNRLLASHNQLSSIQGLDGCNDLQVLDLSHNKITRIGGLDSCVHLQYLDLSHNQLISLRGLQLVPTLLHLDISHNHLPAADHLQDCALLQHLNLASNTLTKPPSLDNHVLLRSLVLDDNSISSLDVLSSAWLPLLSTLSVKQNSLTQVSSLCHLMLLEHLDISYNQLEDVPGVAGGVSACVRLHTLNVTGNPLTEDQSYRSDLAAAIPSLCRLDGEEIQQRSSAPRATELPFVRMCLAQQTQWDSIKQRHEAKLKEAQQSGDVRSCLALQHAHREECYQLAVEHRYAHEYGEMDSSGETDSSGAAVSEKDTGVKDPDLTTDKEKTQLDKVLPVLNVATDSRTQSATSVGRITAKHEEDSTQRVAGKVVTTSGERTSTGASSLQQNSSGALKSVAAVRIQSVWRGYSVRRDIRQHTQDWLEANTIQEAATKIQAVWRGHRLRLRLKRALQAARWDDDDDLDDDDDEFGEVDLSSFDLQAAELDQAWAPPQTPTLPTRHAVLGSVSSQHQDRPQPVWDTRQAWQGAPTPPPPSPKHPLPPVKPPSRASSASSQHHPTPPTSRVGSVISTKSEQLTEEWGFKSGTTAELMMKRARRMKARKKKTLDPHQRLALQRKLAEKEAPPTVRAPARRQPNRVDYFRAKEAMHQFLDSAETEPESVQEAQRQKMTYTWVHSQVGHLDNTPEAPEHDRFIRRTGSTGTLPRLDPDIIATGRVQLVRTPPAAQMDGLELESVDGTSASDLQSHRERRHSIEGDSPRETQFEPSPPKTNSAPSQKLRERLSRHSEADKNAAWGSGRRRIQLFKM